MRRPANIAKLTLFLESLGKSATGRGVVYLTGGATALLLGIRAETIDVDIKLDPEPVGVFDAIAKLKNDLDLNIELAAPDQFIPELPGWRDRSQLISKTGTIEVRHYDFYSQALAKIERGHPNDLEDVRGYLKLGLIDLKKLKEFFDLIRADLVRYPAINIAEYERRVVAFIASH